MNNVLIALVVLAVAGGVALRQGKALARIRNQNERLASQRQVLSERLGELRQRRADADRRLEQAQDRANALKDQRGQAVAAALESIVPPDPARQGGWPANAPYFYLPKSHLGSVGYRLLEEDRLTDDAATLFGMTPTEREAFDASYSALWTKFRDIEIQRMEHAEKPERLHNMINSTSYRIPALEKEADALRADFDAALSGALGSTRTQYLMEAVNGVIASKLENLGQHARVITFGYVQQPNGQMDPMYGITDETAGTSEARTFHELDEDWPITYYARLFGVDVPIKSH